MNQEQLRAVYDLYTAVLTRVRNANKAFIAGKAQRISDIVSGVVSELKVQKRRSQLISPLRQSIDKFTWNNEKPIYAFERIGSDTMTGLYKNLRSGEDVWAVDVETAKDFFRENADKYGYDTTAGLEDSAQAMTYEQPKE